METSFFDRDTSWLAFNSRVLMEAADDTVPLLERLRFLSIYSANLDEFYRVRIPVLLSLKKLEEKTNDTNIANIVTSIGTIVTGQMKDLGAILVNQIIPQLKNENIHLVYNEPIPLFLENDCTAYFIDKVAGFLQPVLLNEQLTDHIIENNKLQILVLLADTTGKEYLAMVNIPCNVLPRFYCKDDIETSTRYIVFMDDIIKANLRKVFARYTIKASYSFKITRDAALDLADEYDDDIAAKLKQQIKKRDFGLATRFLYQPGISIRILHAVVDKLHLTNANIVAGGNYHNLKDLAKVPIADIQHLIYQKQEPINTKAFATTETIFNLLAKKDYLIHTPYESYYPVIRFFNEAAVDNNVTEIYIAIYRVAHNSMIGHSLISAAKNGKKVVVQIELQARFDEASNISYAEVMQTEGIHLIFGVKGLKVHSKICLVERIVNGKLKRYGIISTGNFNESTAKIYTDVSLFTAHQEILKDVSKVFDFFQVNYRIHRYRHLVVSPHYTRNKLYKLIDKEILNSNLGKSTYIKLKMNSLSDTKIIDKLYEASRAGVKIQLIVRGICSLIPGIKGMSDNIEAISIVDNYLEHSRVYIFGNNNNPEVFISSADLMTRNLDARVEVTCPIYDEEIKKELIDTFDMGWKGNVKVRFHSEKLDNKYRLRAENQVFRAQLETYKYYEEKLK